MSILNQKTLNKKVSISGVGLHSGVASTINILPASPNTGIVFKRIDIKNNNIVIPNYLNVIDTNLCTTISNNHNVKISTIEHLMGALYGLNIDNALIEVDAQELPILDGSAKKWIELINTVGIKDSTTPIKIIKINKRVTVSNQNKFIEVDTSKVSLDIDFEIKYPNTLIGTQRNKINIFTDDLKNIFNSRTFCKYEDIDKLRSLGLAKGGTLENAIVVKNYQILNSEGLRNKNEFVNHKILDCMGDLYLSGYKIVGSIKCSQGGHSLTNALLRKVFADKSNYSIIELKGKNLPHSLVEKYQLKSIA